MAASRRDRVKARLRDIESDERGNMVYTGESLRAEDESGRIRFMIVLIVLAACVIGSGCIDAAGAAGSFYVIFPYIGEVSALFALCWNSVKVLAGGSSVRRYVLDNASGKIPGACRILTVFAAAGLLMSGLYIVRNGMDGEAVRSVMYLILKLGAAALAEACRRIYLSIRWITAD
jgi:hypothetical protein